MIQKLLSGWTLLVALCISLGARAQTPQYFFQGGTSNNSFPLSSTTSNKVQWVYTPSTHFPTAPSGLITTVYFKSANAVTSATFTDLTIKLGSDTMTQFAAGAQPWATGQSGLTTVYSATSTTISSIAAGGWFAVSLPVPYLFDATKSLIVEMSQTAYTSGITVVQESVTGDVARQWGLVTSATSTNSGPGRANFGFDWLPACAVPTALSDVAFATSANIGWNPSTSTNIGYEFTYGTSPTPPTGAGTPIGSTSATLTGLTPNTTYYYFVRTVCGPNEYSAYVGDSFKTCNPPSTWFVAQGSPFPATTTICQGDTASLKARGGAGNTYLFLVNGAVMGTGATTDSVLQTMQGGNYRVVVTNASGCYDTSAAAGVTVTVNPLPNPTVTLTGANFLSTGAFSSYQWRLNGNPINLATQQIYTAYTNGVYSVTVTDANGCRATSTPYNLTTASVDDREGASGIRVFPNPTASRVFVESRIPVTAQVWTLDGRKMIQVAEATSVDVSNLTSGVYMLRLTDANGTVLATERLTKTD